MNRLLQSLLTRSSLRTLAVAFVVASAALTGCKPQIGDSCTISTDCSTAGDRLCDTSMPGGYCTIFGCDQDTCPDDSICVEFHHSIDRFERTFCMAPCHKQGDCRSGYQCVNVNGAVQSNIEDAIILDTKPASDSICLP